MPEKDNWLQVRMEGHERDVIDELAKSYNVSTSQLVRLAIDQVARTRPTLTTYPIATEEDEIRFAGREERRWLQMRMSDEERNQLEMVAADYGLDHSKFVRIVLGYFRALRPRLELVPQGKAFALAA